MIYRKLPESCSKRIQHEVEIWEISITVDGKIQNSYKRVFVTC